MRKKILRPDERFNEAALLTSIIGDAIWLRQAGADPAAAAKGGPAFIAVSRASDQTRYPLRTG